MIFSVANHIEQIIKGEKTQTRRSSDRYEVGKTYAIQPARTAKAISQGRIRIIHKMCEVWDLKISPDDAKAEGGYTVEQFEKLYEKLHPNWDARWAYTFRFVPSKKEASS